MSIRKWKKYINGGEKTTLSDWLARHIDYEKKKKKQLQLKFNFASLADWIFFFVRIALLLFALVKLFDEGNDLTGGAHINSICSFN